MQKFVVPQFIDVEDKVIGPITIRQFVLMVIGGILIFVSFKFADVTLFLLLAVIIGLIVFLFGFFKVNGASFHSFLLNVLMTFKKPSLRVWHKDLREEELKFLFQKPKETEEEKEKNKLKKPVSASRLSELSLIVDTRGEYKGEG